MKNIKYYKIDSYNVFLCIHESWKYIIEVDPIEFRNVIEESEACARSKHLELKIEIDKNDFCDGVIYKNYKLNDSVFAYIQYRSVEDDDL